MSSESKCPFSGGMLQHTTAGAKGNGDWWPNQLNLAILHQQSSLSNPMGEEFDYAKEFKTLDLDAVIKDLRALMTDSQDVVAGRLWPLWRPVHPHGVALAPAPTAFTMGAAARPRVAAFCAAQ